MLNSLPILASLDPHPDLTPSVLIGLGWYYLILFFMNFYWTVRSYKQDSELSNKNAKASVWAVVSAVLLMTAAYHFTYPPDGFLIEMPLWFRNFFNAYFLQSRIVLLHVDRGFSCDDCGS